MDDLLKGPAKAQNTSAQAITSLHKQVITLKSAIFEMEVKTRV